MELVDYSAGTVDVLDIANGQWPTLAAPFESKVISDFDTSSSGAAAVVALKDGSVHRSNDKCQTWQQVFQRKDDFVFTPTTARSFVAPPRASCFCPKMVARTGRHVATV